MQGLEGEDLAWGTTVIQERELAKLEIVDGKAVDVGRVKDDADLIDGNVEPVGGGGGIGLRLCAARVGEKRKDKQAADDRR
ncbi:MAG: hypothetical protein ABI197_12640 [Granulicella sp.]